MRKRETRGTLVRRWVPWAALLTVALVRPGGASADARSQALYARGLIPFHARQWEEAYKLFDAATQADPEDAVALYYRGLAAARLGYTNVALQSVEAAVKLRPDLPSAALNLGILYYDAQQYDRAERVLVGAYQQPPTRFSAALFLGLSRYRKENLEGAREYLAEAEKDPALRPTAQYYQGLILLREGQTEAAKTLFAQVQAERPNSEIGRAAGQYLAAPVTPAETLAAEAPAETRPWALWADTRLGYNSNVVMGPRSTSIRKTRVSGGLDDGELAIDFGGSYKLVDSEALEFKVSYDFYQSVFFQITEFDLMSNRFKGDLSSRRFDAFSQPELLQVGVEGWYDYYLLGFEPFAQEGLAVPYARAFEGDVGATQLFYRFRARDYMGDPFNPYLDNYNNAFGAQQYFLLGAEGRQLSIGYQYENENPLSRNGNDFQYGAQQIDLTLTTGVADWVDLVASYVFRLENYQFKNSRTAPPGGTLEEFSLRRHDTENQFLLRLLRSITPQWTVGLTFLGTWNNSNIGNFEYNQYIVAGDVIFRF